MTNDDGISDDGKPLAIDLFCGLGGWTDGLLAENYRVVGFDIKRHEYGEHRYPAQMVIQDVRTLHGSQFKDAALIVASPPCQKFSWMAQPWSKAKVYAAAIRADETGKMLADLTALFNECFRIQLEACEAAGRRIPLIVENVKGAQPWVGPARWNFGSFYLWGDVPALMPITFRGFKSSGMNWSDRTIKGQDFTCIAGNQRIAADDPATKLGGTWFHGYRKGRGPRNHGSKSKGRKMASAMIAKIPERLARHIAATYRPSP